MPLLPVPLLPSLRQPWGPYTFTRPPNLLSHSSQTVIQLNPHRTLVWWKLKLRTIRKIRASKKRLSDGYWKNVPPFLHKTQHALNDVERGMLKAELLRWNGRRFMFLGNYKNRRDAAFAKDENRGIFIGKLSFEPIDKLFQKDRMVWGNPCAYPSEHTRRQFGVGVNFGMDADVQDVRSFSLRC